MIKTDIARRTVVAIGWLSAAAAPLKAVAQTSPAKPTKAGPYDLVILDGRIMDPETMFDAVANVGIKDGRIAAITKDRITGKETVEASGLVVAPGFIDAHCHYPKPIGAKVMLRDGRTTLMDLEVGTLGTRIDQWYKEREGKWQTNFGAASAHELARSLVLDSYEAIDTTMAVKSRAAGNGWSSKRPSLEEGNKILKVLDEGLVAGALGIGSTLGYMRAGVSAREVFEIQRLAGLYGRQTGFHFRYTPGDDTTEVNGIQEMLANAAALGAPALANHFNNPGYNLVHELLTRMRGRGMNVWGEIYPYAAGSTALNAVFLEPEVWVKQLGYRYEDTIQDVASGKFYTQKSREEMLKKEPTRVVLVYKMPKSAIVDWLRMPGVALCSDAMPLVPDDDITWNTPYERLTNTHPRFAGAYAKALRLARENDIPLMQVVAMTAYNWAKPLGEMGLKAMQERGRMQEGMVADITLFDPETVTDNATYEKGTLPSTGIPYVVVNGTIVVRDSEVLKGVNPGQPIRYERVASRFKPLSVERWTKTYYAAPIDFGGGVPGSQPDMHMH